MGLIIELVPVTAAFKQGSANVPLFNFKDFNFGLKNLIQDKFFRESTHGESGNKIASDAISGLPYNYYFPTGFT